MEETIFEHLPEDIKFLEITKYLDLNTLYRYCSTKESYSEKCRKLGPRLLKGRSLDEKRSALLEGIQHNNLPYVEFLLKLGISPDIKYPGALVDAVKNHNLDMVKLLLNYKAVRSGEALEESIRNRDYAIMEFLLNRGIKMINDAYPRGTELEVARSNDPKIISIFLNSGADPRKLLRMAVEHVPYALHTIIKIIGPEYIPYLEQLRPMNVDADRYIDYIIYYYKQKNKI